MGLPEAFRPNDRARGFHEYSFRASHISRIYNIRGQICHSGVMKCAQNSNAINTIPIFIPMRILLQTPSGCISMYKKASIFADYAIKKVRFY